MTGARAARQPKRCLSTNAAVFDASLNTSLALAADEIGVGRRRARTLKGLWALAVLLGGGLGLPVTSSASPPPDVRFLHDGVGRLAVVATANRAVARYVFDASGNIVSIVRSQAAPTSIVGIEPARGAVGTRLRLEGFGFSPSAKADVVKVNGKVARVTAAAPAHADHRKSS